MHTLRLGKRLGVTDNSVEGCQRERGSRKCLDSVWILSVEERNEGGDLEVTYSSD